jgi:hypothetical protein
MASATWGEITSAEGLRDWWWRTVPLLNYTLEFVLQLRKSTENLSQVSRVVGDSRCADLAVFLGTTSAGLLNISLPRLPVGDLGTSAFQVAELRGSPDQLTWVETQCSDVVGEKWNPQILVNLPVTNVPSCVSRSAKTLGLWHLQHADVAAGCGSPHRTRVIRRGTDQLL